MSVEPEIITPRTSLAVYPLRESTLHETFRRVVFKPIYVHHMYNTSMLGVETDRQVKKISTLTGRKGIQPANDIHRGSVLGSLVSVFVFSRRPIAWRQFPSGELEYWSGDAADQSPVAESLCRLPGTFRDHHLRPFTGR